MNMPTAERRGW